MANKVPYYYSDLKKGAVVESEKNNLNKVENPYEKGRGFDNPLLAIEPDISSCGLPEKASTFQKKKKKKKNAATPVYRRSNSLITNSVRASPRANYARKEVVSASENTSSMPRKNPEQCHRRRSSEPNIYEEIPELLHDFSSCYSGSIQGFPLAPNGQNKKSNESDRTSTYSSKVVLDEVEKVQQRHAKILETLNLDVEAMLMPEDTACSDELRSERETSKAEHNVNTDTKLSHVLSPGTPPLYFPSSRLQSGSSSTSGSTIGKSGTLPKPETASLGRRVMNEYILQQSDFGPSSKNIGNQKAATLYGKHSASQRLIEPTYAEKSLEEPLYMLYDDTHRQRSSSRGQQTPEDNIYEEVDLQQMCSMDDLGDTVSWAGSEIPIDQSASSASEENEDESGTSKLSARFIGKKKKNPRKNKEVEGITGGLHRWFSTRKKEYEIEKCVNKINRHSQVLCTDEEGYVDVKIPKKQRPPLSLPSMPTGLTPEQVKRRYIVGSIVDSENSYVNSLQRLIRDFKHPLENSNPPVVSANKIGIMFHRLEQILQCHNIFGIALTQCVRQWDDEEKIGDVFVASFSKTMVLDIYSEFINNFSDAMETAKLASKNKSAFADFLKVKQINSPDRLSFFGLMVKPVQRFPQFILLLQDLLKHTPTGHHDRMSLQLALTQLESLAETLNERKRDAEQHHAVREVLKLLGKFSLKSFADKDHYLLRQDDVSQLQFDQYGLVVKTKSRRLFLLNHLLVAVSVTAKNTDGLQTGERLNLKWAVPLQDVDVQEDSAPTRNILASSGRHAPAGARANERNSGNGSVRILYDELNNLVHDVLVMSKIIALVPSLRRTYDGINFESLDKIYNDIKDQILLKDEEITMLDNCCCLKLSLPLKSKSNKETLFFQIRSPSVKREWTTELRMAKLALDVNNTPAWDLSEQDKRPSSKMPLFVKAFPTFEGNALSEVKCGCHYSVYSCSVPQQYMWLCSTDQSEDSHLVIMAVHLTHLRQVAVYHLPTKIVAIEAVPAMATNKDKEHGCSENIVIDVQPKKVVETVWLATDSKKILVLEGSCPEKWEEIESLTLEADIIQIKYHLDQVFVALSNGTISVFHRNSEGQWQFPNPIVVCFDEEPVTCLLPLGLSLYCVSGPKIWVLDALTVEIQRNYVIQHEDSHALLLAHSGSGLWIAMKNSATVCLYHTETFRHLQDINVASNVNRILATKDKDKSPYAIHVTALVASKGLLWVGTNVGILLTVPLPRLEGVPIITGRLSLAFHAHQGPVTMLLSLQPKAMSHPHLASPTPKRPASADGDTDSSILSSRNKVVKQISDSVLPSPVTKKPIAGLKQVGDIHISGAKTLPRGMTFCAHLSPHEIDDSNDVYGLYADLMNVHDYEKDSQEKLYERLNHSDPELIHFHLNTLDRRVQQKSSRPRSWDLTAMAVSEDSDSSAAYDATAMSTAATETNMLSAESVVGEGAHSPVHQVHGDSTATSTNITLGRPAYKLAHKSAIDSSPKTLLMLTGGSGYINWRKPEKEKSIIHSYVMIWEVKI